MELNIPLLPCRAAAGVEVFDDPLVGELCERVEVHITDLKIGYCTGWGQPHFRP